MPYSRPIVTVPPPNREDPRWQCCESNENLDTIQVKKLRWYACKHCDYVSPANRLAHAKMHHKRIHENGGRAVRKKRKYKMDHDNNIVHNPVYQDHSVTMKQNINVPPALKPKQKKVFRPCKQQPKPQCARKIEFSEANNQATDTMLTSNTPADTKHYVCVAQFGATNGININMAKVTSPNGNLVPTSKSLADSFFNGAVLTPSKRILKNSMQDISPQIISVDDEQVDYDDYNIWTNTETTTETLDDAMFLLSEDNNFWL